MAFVCLALALSPDRAQATFFNRTCAQLDPAQGGAPFQGAVELTVVVGDRIHVTNTAGSVRYRPPGAAIQTAPSPAVFDVGVGQAGNWQFDFFGGQPPIVSCSVGGAIKDRTNTADHLANTFNQIGNSIFGPDGVSGNVINGGGPSGTGFTFAPNNSAFTAPVDTSNPMDRMYGLSSQPQGYPALMGQQLNTGFNFSFDLRSLAANAGKGEVMGAGAVNDVSYMPHSRWNTWVAGRYVDFNDDSAGADRDGHLWWITSGLSYELSERTSVGVFSRIRNGEVDSTALRGSLDSDFYGGGVYLVTRSTNGVRLMTGALYESGDNDIAISDTVNTATGSYDSDQWTVEARIDKRITRGRHWIEPAVKIHYTDLERDGYTNSIGLFIPGSDITLGRLTFGPTVGTTIDRGDMTIKPFARVNGVWDFENENAFTLTNGVVVSDADMALNLGGGVDITYANGLVLSAAGDWFNFDNDLDGWAVTGGVGIPAHMLGLGGVSPAGFVSLDFARNQEDLTAKARLRIPLGKSN